jgi:hypothetical protein
VRRLKDLVIGVVSDYGWDNVEMWALSLVNSGFAGARAVILYDGGAHNETVAARLRFLGFHVLRMPLRGSVVNQRFADMAEVLHPIARLVRYVVMTDVRDVYFQSDPSRWLSDNLTKPILGCSESMRYGDEPWNRENMQTCFPQFFDRMRGVVACNAGVIAGEAPTIADLFATVAMVAKSSGVHNADQAAFNLLLTMEPYRSVTQISKTADGFACHGGAVADPRYIEDHRRYLLEPEPILDWEGVKTHDGKLYPIIHQYDRVPVWNLALRGRLIAELRALQALRTAGDDVAGKESRQQERRNEVLREHA